MKAGSDNFRAAAIAGVMRRLQARGTPMVIYEPLLQAAQYDGIPVVHDLAEFKRVADVIVANRLAAELADVKEKVYTRDVFGRD